jgi:DUF4097 and DUF4098 domain-containing protein YvlB
MSSFPPGYGSGGSPPPPFDRNAWKAQQRIAQAQQRAASVAQRQQLRLQRAQWNAQRRALRHSSFVGPLLLIAIGVVLLLAETGTVSWSHLALWYSHWWPAVLVGGGVVLIAEWAIARGRQHDGQPYPAPILGSGLVFLLILLASVGWSLRYFDGGQPWAYHYFGRDGWTSMLGESHEFDSSLDSPIAPGQPLLVRNPHGDITLTGDSSDGQIHVSVHKQIRAWDQDDAAARERDLQTRFSNDGNQLTFDVGQADGSSADLTIEAPHDTPILIESDHGDVTLTELHAPVSITANRGDVELSAIAGNVSLRLDHDDGSVTGHSITGAVDLSGRTGDVSLTNIAGPVTMRGDFFGETELSHVAGAVRFHTSRTDFEAARLDGDVDIDKGSDFSADQLLGPVVLTTSNRNIEFDRVQGQLSITYRNGSVDVTSAAPLGSLVIHNEQGSVDVGVPPSASFTLDASARDGSIDANDFGLTSSGNDSSRAMRGTTGSGGPSMNITTTDGDITVRKTAVASLAPAPPPVPKLSGNPVRADDHTAPRKHSVPSAKPSPAAKPQAPNDSF